MSQGGEMIGLAVAAARLKIPYQDAHRLLLTGRLGGEKRKGRWFVSAADVEMERQRTEASGTQRKRVREHSLE